MAQTAVLTDRFTAVPKTRELVALGVSPAAISTYNALADYANNKTGECWPMMKTLARILDRAAKTIQRHVRQLEEAGLIEILERRRDERGRFLGWRFRLPHLAAAAKRIQARREENRKAYEERKQKQEAEREARRRRRLSSRRRAAGHEPEDDDEERKRQEERRHRWRGYEWFFGSESQEDPNGREPTDTSAPSTGHLCPVGSNKTLTSSDNHLPPNPPRGAEKNKSFIAPITDGIEGNVVSTVPPVRDAEAAWAAVVGALISRHKDGVPSWFGAYRLASLSGLTLTIYLHDFPIRNPRNMQLGRAAELTIAGYGQELAHLWRKVAGDETAILDLRSGRP